ncbi:hypothetical protein BX661DRAFT_222679 [Kickxella alabastrina]|uniref:uncharacterized protein n=1 Tax=Kickxella alabastrina TaxID=61397 RepID=UPI002220D911|nr:uncharacterized protein BX661DRAFT_222679 [Kickxella alabastrina]KAI7833885.1 hypothetical protein BX661DRAFT_222679 [Kickxella alabastrina]
MFGGIFNTLQTASQRLTMAAFSQSILSGPQAQAVRGHAKRWKAIAKGLYQRRQAGMRHLNRRLSPDARRGKHAPVVCTEFQRRHLDRLLPY